MMMMVIIIIIIIIRRRTINMIKKEAEKILKYKDFTTEIQRTWNVKTKVIPDTGDWDYFKVSQKIREQHTRKYEVKELQKTAILGTAHIIRKVLM
jgi:hypothetical protein